MPLGFSIPLKRLSLALALALVTSSFAAPALADTVEIKGITWNAARNAYIVEANGELSPRVSHLDAPARLVIDLPGTHLIPSYQALDGASGSGISRVRVAQFKAGVTRIVLDLTRPMKFDLEQGGNELVIPVDSAKVATGSIVHTPTIRAIQRQGDGIFIAMSQRTPYWTHVISGAGKAVRYVVVFPNTRLAPSLLGTVPVGVRGIQRLTATQQGSESRLLLDLTSPPTFDVHATTQGWRFGTSRAQLASEPAPPPPRPTTPVPTQRPVPVKPRKTASPRVETSAWTQPPDAPLALRKVDGHWQMLLSADNRFQYRTTAVGDDRVHVDIMGGKVALPRDSVYIDNGLIARVRVNPGANGATRLTIDLDQPIRHSARLLPNQRSLLLGFHRTGKDRITLDPGHGGTDAGAVGQKGIREKDVTLAIATRLARVMESNGMSVQMTRMKDLEILLRPRVEMANRNDADVFVSIHANSFGSQHGVNGIETYYFSDESAPLARSIHKSLLRTLGRPDRGVRKNNFYVVHHTKMPAALIEIGYLSNAEEEALLASPAYQERAANAIYAGIKEFITARKSKPH